MKNYISRSICFFFSVAIIFSLANYSQALTLYVSPDGNDSYSGTLAKVTDVVRDNKTLTDGPKASLSGARDAIRRLKAKGPLKKSVEVIVQDGTYTLIEPLVLTSQDSGTEKFPIVYRSADGAKPIFSGGRIIKNFKPAADGIWQTEIPEVKADKWYFEQLFVNDRRAVRARTPNKFYFYTGPSTEVLVDEAQKKYRYTTPVKPHVIASLANTDSQALSDVTVVAYHNWNITRRFLTAIDSSANAIITIGPKMLGQMVPWVENTRFHLENFKAAIDLPGEWFLARSGIVYYKPLPGEDMTKAHVVAPVIEKLVILQGTPQPGQRVEYIKFKGLAFHHTQTDLSPDGYQPSQAASATDAAIMADGARNISFENCQVNHTAAYCIWFRQACRDCRVERCYLYDLGAGGIRIGEGTVPVDMPSRTSYITVDNNIIRSGGRIYTDAVGVWVGQSGDNSITHNEIADLFYSGLSIGWRWGYAESLAKHNTIRYNNVHHIGWGVLSDMGGVYTMGRSEGTVVSNNIFHDIYSYGYGGWGLYADEGSSFVLMENNLVYNTKSGGFHQHYGKENIIRNNILAFAKLYQIAVTRTDVKDLSFTFENNIVYYDKGVLFGGNWDKLKKIDMDNNCYCAIGKNVAFMGKSLAEWTKLTGHDAHSIVAKEVFVDAKNYNFRLIPDSPALKVGFRPFDYTTAGVYGSKDWIEKASNAKFPPLEIPPDPAK